MTPQRGEELWIPLYGGKIRGPRNIFITSFHTYGDAHGSGRTQIVSE